MSARLVALVLGLALALPGCGRRYRVGPRVAVDTFELRLPAVVRRELAGGLTIDAIAGAPGSVVVGVAIRAPERPADRPLQQLTFAALADEAERAAAARGALFAADQVDDGVAWFVQAGGDEAAALLDGQARLVQAPAHEPARIAALHDEHRAVIDAWAVEPLAIAGSLVRSRSYPADHPYARSWIARRDLARVDATAIRGAHGELVRPGAAAVIVVGDGDLEALAEQAAGAFAGWLEGPVPEDIDERPVAEAGGAGSPENGERAREAAPALNTGSGAAGGSGENGGMARESAPDATRQRTPLLAAPAKGGGDARDFTSVVDVTQPVASLVKDPPLLLLEAADAPQAILILERATIPRSDPDYVFLELGAAVLASVLHRRLREEGALTYGVTATLDARRGPSPLTIVTRVDRDRAGEAVAGILEGFADLRAAPVDAAIGEHLFPAQSVEAMLAVETGLGVGAWAGRAFLFGDDPRRAEDEVRRLRVRPEAGVNRVMAGFFVVEAFTVAMVGDPARLQPALARIGRPVERQGLAEARARLLE